jgi:hypothetical protein
MLKLFVRRATIKTEKKREEPTAHDSSDSEADDVVPIVPGTVVQPVVPPLAVERVLDRDVDVKTEPTSPADERPTATEAPVVPTKEAVPDDEPVSREHECTIELLSRLYDCDASKEMLDMFSRVDFTPIVSRRVDAVAQEVHVDVDKIALRHLTVTRTNLWIGNGLYEKAEATLTAALEVWPGDAILEYNIACASSLRGDVNKSIKHLRDAVTHGYRNTQQMKRDPDLSHVRDHPEFTAVLDLARGGAPATPPAAPVAMPSVATPKEETDVDRLIAVFPHLTAVEAAGLLRRFGSLTTAVNHCLMHP